MPGDTFGDVGSAAIFAKLVTDGKLPAGTVTLSTTVVLTATVTSVAHGSSLTLAENAASAKFEHHAER